MTAELMSDQAYSEAIGWLVSAVGRDFILHQADSADSAGNTVVSAQLRDWAERLTPEGDSTEALHRFRIARAAAALEDAAGPGVWQTGEAETWAYFALRGAGVIRNLSAVASAFSSAAPRPRAEGAHGTTGVRAPVPPSGLGAGGSTSQTDHRPGTLNPEPAYRPNDLGQNGR